MTEPGGGVLRGVRIIEMEAIGPVPHAASVLASLGADVIRVTRPGSEADLPPRASIRLSLKDYRDVHGLLDLVGYADVLLEGHRPGVMERLGLGPVECRRLQPALVYARMTGWGQEGPLASVAGHDINYLAASGVLSTLGHPDTPPPPPLNLVGDYGGGSMLLVVGVLGALLERTRSGVGQVVDVSMLDGIGALASPLMDMRRAGQWTDRRMANLLDGGAPFYSTYACADDRYVAVGALEAKFYAQLLEVLGLQDEDLPDRDDPDTWPELRTIFAARFRTRARDEWAEVVSGTDACVTPVLTLEEASSSDNPAGRAILGERAIADAPRFSRTPSQIVEPAGSTELSVESAVERWSTARE